jgi:hypothetical protein
MDATSEFLKAWAELELSAAQPKPIIEYRIYYDSDSGVILDYTNEIREGTYLTVDRETFIKHQFNLKVKNGKLIGIKPTVGKLVPGAEGVACHPNDITIVVDPTSPSTFWNNQTYDD